MKDFPLEDLPLASYGDLSSDMLNRRHRQVLLLPYSLDYLGYNRQFLHATLEYVDENLQLQQSLYN